MVNAMTAEMRLAEAYKQSKRDMIAQGLIPVDTGVDYRAYLNTSRAVKAELDALRRLDRVQDDMFAPRKMSKRWDRLVRMYYALRRAGR